MYQEDRYVVVCHECGRKPLHTKAAMDVGVLQQCLSCRNWHKDGFVLPHIDDILNDTRRI